MPRPSDRKELKQDLNLTVTKTAKEGLATLAEEHDYPSISALAEAIGRKELPIGQAGISKSLARSLLKELQKFLGESNK